MPSIVLIDDDLAMDILIDNLRFRGHDANRISSAADAISEIDRIVSADLVVLDIIMPWPDDRESSTLTGAASAGMEVLREIRRQNKDLAVIAYSATQDATVMEVLRDDPKCFFLSKWESHSLRALLERVNQALGLPSKSSAPQSFIVRWRDCKF